MKYPHPAREARIEALRREFRADLTPSPDERLAIPERANEWAPGLKPQSFFAAWLVDQTAALGLRIDRLQRIERRGRLRRSIRAAFFWDDDRRVEAEKIGADLANDPAAVRFALEQTPQGCDWLILRWSHLARLLDSPAGWGEPEQALALNLLATPPDLRATDPLAPFRANPRPLIAREIARIEAIRDGVIGDIDDFDRANAEADLVDDQSPEARQLRRDLAALHHRLRWCLDQLKNPVTGPGATFDFLERCFPLPRPEAPPEPAIEATVEDQPEPEPDIPLAPPIPKPAPSSRRHRRAKAARDRQTGRRPDLCPS